MSGQSIGVVKKVNGEVFSLDWANTVTLDGVSAVQMPFGPMDVQAYKTDGVDLLISLNSGDVVTIENFFTEFGEDEEISELVLQDEQGVLWRGQFDPMTSEFNFTEIAALDAGADIASGALLNMPDWAMLGLAVLAVGGGAVAVHNSGSSSSSSKRLTPSGPEAPNVPEAPTEIKLTGAVVTGKAAAGLTVQVTDADGNLLGKEVIVDENGNFEYGLLPDELPKDGESIFVTVKDSAGVSSEPVEFVNQDNTNGEDLDAGFDPESNGSIIKGNVEPGSTVTATADGNEVGSATADENGDFSITIDPALTNGETVTIVVKSPEGEVVGGGNIEADDTTPPAPAEDIEFSADGAVITGQAEPGATVTVESSGETALVDAGGDFELTLDTPLTNGEQVTVTVKDAAGNESEATDINAPDTTAPNAPTDLQVSDDGTSLTGKAEPGSTVVVKVTVTAVDGSTQIVDGMVDADGNFSIDFESALKNGETITVTATDNAGNSSEPVSTPDTTAPDQATGLKVSSGGTILTGKGEAGAAVVVKSGEEQIGTGIVDANGDFVVTLDPRQVAGQELSVTLTDNAGNSSEPVSTIAPDTTAPDVAKDVIVSEDGTTVKGTAAAGSTVKVTVGGQEFTTTADAEGSFTVPLDPPLTNGETVTVVVTVVVTQDDKDSDPITVNAPDSTAPDQAQNVKFNDEGTLITGQAEPGATVTVEPSGETALVDVDGDFELTLDTPLTNGEQVTVIVKDAAGNKSVAIDVKALDTTAPNAPAELEISEEGTVITGTAEAGSIVKVIVGGKEIASGTTDEDGSFAVDLDPALNNGETITVTATDAAGNKSESTEIEAPAMIPLDAPDEVVISTDGSSLTGKGKPGSSVVIKDAEGKDVAIQADSNIVDSEGNFKVVFEPARIDGQDLTVSLAKDGQTSAGVKVTAPSLEPEYADNIIEDSVMLTINQKKTDLALEDKTDTVGGLLFIGKLVGEGQEFTVAQNHSVSGTVSMTTPGGFNVIGGDQLSIQKKNASGGWDDVLTSSTGNIVQTGDEIQLKVEDFGPGEYRVRSFTMGVLGGTKVIFEADLAETDLASVGEVEFANPSEGSDARTNNLLEMAKLEDGAQVSKVNGYTIAQGKYEVAGEYGVLVMRSNGDYEYRPNPSAKGIGKQDQFTYDIVDADGNISKGTIVIDVGSEQWADAVIVANDDSVDSALNYKTVTDANSSTVLDEFVNTGSNGRRKFVEEFKYEVGENKLSEFTVSLNHLVGKAYTVTIRDQDGNLVDQQSGSLPTGYRDITFDGLAAGQYDVKIEVTGALNATNLRIKTSEKITHLDRYELEEAPAKSTGNLLEDDIKGSDFTAFEIKNAQGDFVNIYSLPGKEITVEGQYGSLTVDFEGNYSYQPNDDVPYTGQDLQEEFEYKLIAVNGEESLAKVTVDIEVSGPAFIEPSGEMDSLSFDFSAMEQFTEFDLFDYESAVLELSLEDVLDSSDENEQLSVFAEDDNSVSVQASSVKTSHSDTLDVAPVIDPLDDAFEQHHLVI